MSNSEKLGSWTDIAKVGGGTVGGGRVEANAKALS